MVLWFCYRHVLFKSFIVLVLLREDERNCGSTIMLNVIIWVSIHDIFYSWRTHNKCCEERCREKHGEIFYAEI